MPELARFYGIAIRMYFGDHPPPHFHALYGEYEVLIAIEDLSVVAGSLPARALGLVIEWASLRHSEVRDAWAKAASDELPGKIDPLP